MTGTPTPSHSVDARGQNCPLPILRTRKAMAGLAPGELLELLATDPGSVKDIEAFCRQTGSELLRSDEADGGFTFLLRKGG